MQGDVGLLLYIKFVVMYENKKLKKYKRNLCGKLTVMVHDTHFVPSISKPSLLFNCLSNRNCTLNFCCGFSFSHPVNIYRLEIEGSFVFPSYPLNIHCKLRSVLQDVPFIPNVGGAFMSHFTSCYI